MLHYYLNLPKDNPSINFEKNIEISKGKLYAARKSFEPFETYIQNVITVLEGKEAVQAGWKEVNLKNKNIAQLSIFPPKGGLYEIPKKTVIQFLNNNKGNYRISLKSGEPDFEEKLIYKADGKTNKISVLPENFEKGIIQLPVEAEKFDKVTWGGEDVELEPAWIVFQKDGVLESGNSEKYTILSIDADTLTIEGELSAGEKLSFNGKEILYSIDQKQRAPIPQGVTIREEKHRRVIYSEKEIAGFDKINNFESFITGHTLCFEDGSKLDAEREGRNLLLANGDDYGKTVTANNIKFSVDKLKKANKETYRIQLFETGESEKDDDIQTLPPLRHFFDDDISIEDENRNQYSVIDGRESENTLILKNIKENKIDFPKGDILKVRVNTYQLKKQLEAVTTLKNMPAADHASLIKLFENKNDPFVRWAYPFNQRVDEWYVITETNRSGYEEQRDFVNKALNTKDFAILEGPPGSGKTTVILELICQLAKLKKRVLLCGSTHVAIDNILERLKEKSFLEKLNILPVRIGDEKRINQDIREFQINNLIEDNVIDEDLLLETANLVCGTTIGILQHPKFKKRKGNLFKNPKYGKYQYSSDTPIIPEFDYLIIDESSKTTFQEFLVPALYAKRWILAGDVMQLSPFTERENIVTNIENLTIDGKPLSKDLQAAVFYLQKMKDCVRYGGNRFVLPVSSEIIKEMHLELNSGRKEDFYDKLILFVTKNIIQSADDHILVRNFKNINFLEIAASDIIFVDEDNLRDIFPYLSERHAVLRSDPWYESEHAFVHNLYQKYNRFSYKEKGQEFRNSFEIIKRINYYLQDKNWAEEIAWRIDREHQLRLKEKNKNKEWYTRIIEELLPKCIENAKAEDAVNSVAEMAFPSILESLVQGIKGRKTNIESAISDGFNKDDLEKRKTTLVYQHRMHSEISKFPREQFYKSTDALKDLEEPAPIDALRDWKYDRYPSRSVWVNVAGVTNRSSNTREVEVLMEHLNKFIQYAINNPHPEKKEWEVACITFYRRQENLIREKLQALCKEENKISNFTYKETNIKIKLHTVDKFQGHEADVVFLSMVQTNRVGFLDNPNRLNVAITRAKFQLVVFGNRDYFLKQTDSDDLKELARSMPCV